MFLVIKNIQHLCLQHEGSITFLQVSEKVLPLAALTPKLSIMRPVLIMTRLCGIHVSELCAGNTSAHSSHSPCMSR